MRGTKAKAIRRAVYGDQSLRNPRKYVAIQHGVDKQDQPIIQIRNHPDSLRAKYQQAKRCA
jgi:hypothetical protein